MPSAYKKAIRRSRNAIKDFQAADNADISGDYTAVNSQLAAITANLATAGKGIGANFTKSQQQALRAMNRNTASGLRTAKRTMARTQRRMTNEYGSAIGGATGRSALATSRALVGGTKDVRRATLQAGGLLALGGQTALSLQKKGAQEAAAGADYATAVALKSRNQTSAAQVAEMEYGLQQTILAHEQAKELSRMEFRQQRTLLQEEQEEAEKEQRASYGQVYAMTGQISGAMATTERVPVYAKEDLDPTTGQPVAGATPESWRKPTTGERINMLVEELGITEADVDQYRLVQEVARNMGNGMDANEATNAAVATLYGDEKGFKLEKAESSVRTGTRGAHMEFISETLRKIAAQEDLPGGTWGKLISIMRGYKEYAGLAEQLNALTTAETEQRWGFGGAGQYTSDEMIEDRVRKYLENH